LPIAFLNPGEAAVFSADVIILGYALLAYVNRIGLLVLRGIAGPDPGCPVFIN